MKQMIIAIIGPSGAGKTFASEFLKEKMGIPVIVSYTTRPMRDGETNGVEHHFVDESMMPPKEQMMAYTKYGNYHYWTTFSQAPRSGMCTYVIDEKGLLDLIYADFIEIRAVYINRDKDTLEREVSKERIERDSDRIEINKQLYKCIIDNNGTLEEFKDKLRTMANNI